MTFDDYIRRIKEENDKILKSLGSDYDEEGISYWEKWGSQVDKEESKDIE
jgi:trimethylamine:corrinoid methyltransferase-like protein